VEVGRQPGAREYALAAGIASFALRASALAACRTRPPAARRLAMPGRAHLVAERCGSATSLGFCGGN